MAGKNFTLFPHTATLLEALINRHKAGSPTDSSVFWTHLKPKEFAGIFMEEHGLQQNEGFITIGTSHETAAFVAENLLWWWGNFGIHHYPSASVILVFCDAGGANSYRHHAFKEQMLALAATIGRDILICHYPPYASKWNPIEHRLFAHVHHAIQGIVFSDYKIVKELMEKTRTDTGLKVYVRILDKQFDTGIKTHKAQIDFSRIQHHPIIPELSYRIAA